MHMMHSLPVTTTLFLLLCLQSTTRPVLSKSDPRDQKYFTECPPISCGSLQIRFPLHLRSSSPPCRRGHKGLELTCHGNETLILSLPSSPSPLRVTAIDYLQSLLTVDIGSGSKPETSPCPLRNLTSLSLTHLATPIYTPVSITNITLISCSKQFAVPGPDSGTHVLMAGPISCLSGPGYYVYVVDESEYMDVVPSNCIVVKSGGQISYSLDDGDYYAPPIRNKYSSYGELLDAFLNKRKVSLSWNNIPGISDTCIECERAGRLCGFSEESNSGFCQKPTHHGDHGRPIKITGPSIGGLLILVSVLIFVYISRLSVKEKETRLKVERFLATYKSTNPTRYSHSDIKKITKHFKHKLGEGGFGSVYKGKLRNGIPVAVKMLEKSKGKGEEFINEVATIGRIHHVNVVRLLGFCSEGTKHALIYEFMPNESLEKFIFSEASKRYGQPFSMEKLQDIAIGIARGIEYLHQGCDQRILHFDIKPHNILLDHDFNPKISDFGLAKLCSRDASIITMTAARGTTGYIAPEIYSRNFGAVSYKSDVYSFGMLMLEMVTGRKNVDPAIENQSDVYFPEWLYERLANGEDLGFATVEGEEDIVNKLVIVAFWCIQWSPTDRPTMTRVVQLLLGNLESLSMPPKPFVSSSDQGNCTSVSVEL